MGQNRFFSAGGFRRKFSGEEAADRPSHPPVDELDVITVHGTFAGDPEQRDEGDSWWQRGSPFWEGVQQYLDTRLTIKPLHWSGANSEVDRRKTGTALHKLLKRRTSDEVPPLVVGHSHGASSTVQALLLRYLSKPNQPFDHIRGFISIGMPLILFKSNRNPITWLNLTGRIVLTVVAGIFLIFGLGLYRTLSSGQQLEGWDISSALGTPTVLLAIVALFLRRNFRRQSAFGRNILLDKASGVYTQLAHSKDEAINALREGVTIKPTVIRFPQVFVGAFSFFSLAFVANTYVEYVGNEVAEAEMRSNTPEDSDLLGPIVTDLGSIFSDAGVFAPKQFLQFKNENRNVVSQYFFRDFILKKDLRVEPFSNIIDAASSLTDELESVLEAIGEKDRSILELYQSDQNNLQGAISGFLLENTTSSLSAKLVTQLIQSMNLQISVGDEMVAPEVQLCKYSSDIALFRDWLTIVRRVSNDLKIAIPTTDDSVQNAAITMVIERLNILSAVNYLYVANECGLEKGFLGAFGDAPPSPSFQDNLAEILSDIRTGAGLLILPVNSSVEVRQFDADIIPKGTTLETSMFEAARLWRCFAVLTYSRDGTLNWLECGSLLKPIRKPTDLLFEWHHRVASFISRVIADIMFRLQTNVYGVPDNFLIKMEYVTDDAGILYNSARLIPVLAFSALLAAITALIGAPIVNSYLNGILRGQAYGNDGYGERVVGVAPSIDVEDKTVGTLPARVEEEMNALSHEDAPAAIDRLRALIASGALTTGEAGHDPLAVATKFDGAELLHNGYFVSEQFAKYFAVQLVEKYGLNPSETYLTDPDIEFYRAELVSV